MPDFIQRGLGGTALEGPDRGRVGLVLQRWPGGGESCGFCKGEMVL